MKKYVAFLLVLCFLAVLPLTAAAEEYDTCVIGSWYVVEAYDGDTEEITSYYAEVSHVNIREDGTCDWSIGSDVYYGTWAYVSTFSAGYQYTMTVDYEGTQLPITFTYCNSKDYSFYGSVILELGNMLYTYKKA